jgi:hypothetical protein
LREPVLFMLSYLAPLRLTGTWLPASPSSELLLEAPLMPIARDLDEGALASQKCFG